MRLKLKQGCKLLKADFSPSKNKKEMTTMANTLAVTTSNAKGTPNQNENLQVRHGADNEEEEEERERDMRKRGRGGERDKEEEEEE